MAKKPASAEGIAGKKYGRKQKKGASEPKRKKGEG